MWKRYGWILTVVAPALTNTRLMATRFMATFASAVRHVWPELIGYVSRADWTHIEPIVGDVESGIYALPLGDFPAFSARADKLCGEPWAAVDEKGVMTGGCSVTILCLLEHLSIEGSRMYAGKCYEVLKGFAKLPVGCLCGKKYCCELGWLLVLALLVIIVARTPKLMADLASMIGSAWRAITSAEVFPIAVIG
ncbi:MAG: hypothetical protein IPK26_21780 [Planctomycetes bacterium]|nr:hypothetical protein [Planctomycetota bacterium]